MIDKHVELRDRTKKFSFRIIRLFKQLPRSADAEIIGKQLLRCSTSVAANYRAVGRCRTKAVAVEKLFFGPKCRHVPPDLMAGNVSEIEKAVYRASWRDVILGARDKKEFFNSHG